MASPIRRRISLLGKRMDGALKSQYRECPGRTWRRTKECRQRLEKGDFPLPIGHSLSEGMTYLLPITVFFLRASGTESPLYLFSLVSEEGIGLIEKPLKWIEAFDPI
jgi:hypothetical protein